MIADDLFAGAGGWDLAAALSVLRNAVRAPCDRSHCLRRSIGDALGWSANMTVHHIRGAGMTERHGARPGRRADQPCFTVTSKARSWMVEDAQTGSRRPFTIEEASVVQSFPRDYPWAGSRSRQFLQAGNAVPPGLALHALAAAAGIKAEERAA